MTGGSRGRGQDWRGRGRGRSFDARRGGRGRGAHPPGRANTCTVVELTADELERWRQFKNLSLGAGQSSEATVASSSTNFSGNSSYTTDCGDNLATSAQWLIDSGASTHMTSSNRSFIAIFMV